MPTQFIRFLKVDSLISSMLPRLTADQLGELKGSMERDGYDKHHPVVLWRERRNVIVDGEHRYLIARELGIKTVPVVFKSFATIEDVERWVLSHHLGRRNLDASSNAWKLAIGRLYNLQKADPKANLTPGPPSSAHREHSKETSGKPQNGSQTTATDIAAKKGVGASTVRRYAKQEEKVREMPPAEQEAVTTGKARLPTQERAARVMSAARPGSVLFERAELDKACGVLERLIDKTCSNYGQLRPDGTVHEKAADLGLRRKLREFKAEFVMWQKDLEKYRPKTVEE